MRVSFKEQMNCLKKSHFDLYVDLKDLTTLEGVFKWVRSVSYAGAINLLPLDEFSHEMIIHLTDRDNYLVFGST